VAIYSVHHSSIGKTTHQPGTASAHVSYITRRSAARAVMSARMPIAAPGQGGAVRAWFDLEEAASRKNGRVADRLMLALPRELDGEQRQKLVQDFAEAATAGRAPWLFAIHDKGKDAGNPHAHCLIRDRDPTTGKRVVGLSEKGSTDRLREMWESHANAALAAAGAEARIDRRSLAAQGVDRAAEIHVGPISFAMEERGVRPHSHDRFDATGREIRWSEIDAGRTRAERRDEIVAANAAASPIIPVAVHVDHPGLSAEKVEPEPLAAPLSPPTAEIIANDPRLEPIIAAARSAERTAQSDGRAYRERRGRLHDHIRSADRADSAANRANDRNRNRFRQLIDFIGDQIERFIGMRGRREIPTQKPVIEK